MDPFDREKTRAVWRRVLDRPDQKPLDPAPAADRTLLARELQRSAGLYFHLAHLAGSTAGRCLEELAASAREDAALLRGMERYDTGRFQEPTAQGLPAPGNLEMGLRTAIAREEALAAAMTEAREDQSLLRSCARRRRGAYILLGGGKSFHI